MPLFSVVIPTYNREAYVAATLDSLLAQECEDWELIVVDDGSTDSTLDIVRRYAEGLPGRVQILEQDHRGCAAARNRGVGVATGEYLAFLDSDDLWFPWTLRTARDVIEAEDQPSVVGFALRSFYEEAEVEKIDEAPLRTERGVDYLTDGMRLEFAMGVAHTVCRREAYLACGGCVEKNVNGTDSDVLLKMGLAPGFVRVYEPMLLAYRQHEGGVIRNPVMAHAGARMLLEHEAEGVYPGGLERRPDRLEQILRRVRAVSLRCVREGRRDLGFDLFRRSMRWNAWTGRWTYLAAFPAICVAPGLQKLALKLRPLNTD